MKTTTSPTFHPAFTLNGLQYETTEELLYFANGLSKQGDSHEISIARFLKEWLNEEDYIVVNTSGTTGEPKEIKLLKKHMIASAEATGRYFKLGAGITALLCLSTSYIAGKMMLVRAMTLGWKLHVVAPEKDALTQYDNNYDFAAMVPYQVAHSIEDLGQVKKLIVGGGAISLELEEKLLEVPTEVFATYGMTETCTHVAIRPINGSRRSVSFEALPGIDFSKDDRGCLVIDAKAITSKQIVTNDQVLLHSTSSFTWLGRIDNVINSGGVKIFPEKVEDKLSRYIKRPFIIASDASETLGEKVVIIIENKEGQNLPDYSQAFHSLEKYERPKKIYTVSQFPFTDTEKIKRKDLLEVVHKYRR